MGNTLDRRSFLRNAALTTAAVPLAVGASAQSPAQQPSTPPAKPDAADAVSFKPIHNTATEAVEKTPGPFAPPDGRVGYAIVGLGRLAVNQILPAMGKSKYCKPVALVSGSPDKAKKIAAQYGIRPEAIYDYAGYDRLAQNPEVKVIYIVLPNSMHREFVARGAKAGKHILCEKPMATSAADCEAMIAACRHAGVKLMIAYRQQYEPMNRAIVKMVREGKLGKLRSVIATNSQNMANTPQWRLDRKLAGGGCLPDVGVYCLNAARFLSGEEPSEVTATLIQPSDDPRFHEVESTVAWTMRFPSGLVAALNTSYDSHSSQWLRVEGSEAWAELDPAFGYTGLKLRVSRLLEGHETPSEPKIAAVDQFAAEMDHMALCVLDNREPHTGGREGLQDQRVMDAIYESARSGEAVKLAQPSEPTRGPELAEPAQA